MALVYPYVFLALMVMTSFVGFLSTAPTGDYDNEDYVDPWDTLVETSISTTTAAPLRPELECEKTTEAFNKTMSKSIKDDIEKLMGEYNNWGKLLAPAPVAIGILGQLILMANQINDFPINREDPSKTFKHIKHPKSFRTTLLQISHRGYMAFFKAHRNMDAIRVHNRAVPSDIKDAVRYLASENSRIIELRLPPTLARITEVARRSQELSKEVVDEFNLVLELIYETEMAVTLTKSSNEIRLDDINLDLELNNQTKVFTEKENMILEEKDTKMKEMLERLEYRKGHLYHTTSFGNIKFTLNLAKDWVAQLGQKRYNKVKNILHSKSNNWTYTYHEEFIDTNPCAQENSQQLLDLLIVFGQYRTSYEHWQKTYNRDTTFDGTKVINSFERAFGSLKNCTEISNIIIKGMELMKKMKSPDMFKSKDKKAGRPVEKEVDEIIVMVDNLRNAANNVTKVTGRKQEIVVTSAWDLYAASKENKMNQLESMSETMEAVIKLNNDLMKIRRQKTQQILNRIISLDFSKVHIEEVIQTLKEGLIELGKLKNDWGNLIQFFDKIRTFIESASRHSTGLVEIVHTLSKNAAVNMKDKFLFNELGMNFEKSNEAVLLVYGIADMYVNVSNLYIMNRLTKLNTMNSMRTEGISHEELVKVKENITMDATEASQGIENYIQAHEKKLNEALKIRHEGLYREYRKMIFCIRKFGIKDLAINFTGADDWFQIKSQTSGKVIEVSSENQVQMWESNNGDNQLWYLDKEEVIRSVTTDFCMTSNGARHVTVEPCQNKTINQKWTLQNNTIFNIDNPDRSLAVHDKDNANGARLDEVDIKKTAKQLWDMADP